ncbi:J domain-containing protein [Rhodopirellula bahusiensis]|uniref:J domain-containing protein n=3 Tax=Rhodopirellula bahusiensis TaxID=2014065 RepID=UPI003266D723
MSDPAWHHLPHDPRSFFDLAEDFDRRDLKRAYGKLIRQFKPETHPQEFQRIRAAYEQLENAERYGRSQTESQNAADAWKSGAASEPQPKSDTSPSEIPDPSGGRSAPKRPAAPVSPVDEAIAKPRESYVRLSQKHSRTPLEYYILAVLSDLLVKPSEKNPKQRPQFLQWLLDGLQEHPQEPGLISLVAGTLRGDVPDDQIVTLLPRIAKAIRSSMFYRLTEPLWERLLIDQPFEVFERLIQECESHLRQGDPRARLAFYLRILRTAIWTAPPEWTQSHLETLSAQAADLDDSMQNDLEFVELLHSYLSSTKPSESALPARATMESFLRTYCTGDGPVATAEMARCLDEIARDSHGVQASFPINQDSDDHSLFLLMMMATSDLAETTGVIAPSPDEQKNNRQAVSCLRDLKSTLEDIGNRVSWMDSTYKWLPFAGLYLVFGILFTVIWLIAMTIINQVTYSSASGPISVLMMIAGLLSFPVLYFWWFYPKYLAERAENARQKYFATCYTKRWRGRLFRYVQSCGESPSESLTRLNEAAAFHDDTNWMNLVLGFCHGDLGLLIFARAQLFVG